MTAIFVLPLAIMLTLVVVFMIVYPRYYKKKINKDIQEGNPIRVIEPVYLYGGLLFLVMIILSIFTIISIKSLEDSLRMTFNSRFSSLEFQQERLLTEFWDLNEELAQINAEGSVIQLFDFEVIEEIDNAEDMYLVKLTFALTENIPSESAELVIESSAETRTYDLNDTTARQSLTLELNLHEDYLLYVNVTDGQATNTYDFETFNLYQYLKERFTLFVDFDTTNGPRVDYSLTNQWENASEGVPSEALRIKEVHITIIHDGVELVSNTYTTPSTWSSHTETYGQQYVFDDTPSSGTWQVLITVIDEYGIEYTNLGY